MGSTCPERKMLSFPSLELQRVCGPVRLVRLLLDLTTLGVGSGTTRRAASMLDSGDEIRRAMPKGEELQVKLLMGVG